MKWAEPPLNKVYEALGAIGDDRIKLDGATAKIYSSSGNKYYDVAYDESTRTIASNDNASFFVGYLGYPAIALLLELGIVSYDPMLAKYLTGFAWKDINQRFKNDFEKTDHYIDAQIHATYGVDIEAVHTKLETIRSAVMQLGLEKPVTKQRPTKGY